MGADENLLQDGEMWVLLLGGPRGRRFGGEVCRVIYHIDCRIMPEGRVERDETGVFEPRVFTLRRRLHTILFIAVVLHLLLMLLLKILYAPKLIYFDNGGSDGGTTAVGGEMRNTTNTTEAYYGFWDEDYDA